MSLRLATTMTSTYVLDDGGLNVTSAMERGGGEVLLWVLQINKHLSEVAPASPYIGITVV